MTLKNNPGNAEIFKRYVMGARLARGKAIPDKNIINLNISTDPKIKILANIQGSNNAKYVVDIFEDFNKINIIHDCPDFKKNFKFCKHVVKVLLLIEPEICEAICKNIRNINFSSNFNLVKQSKIENFILKAEELIKNSKIYEAINFLEQAYNESNNFSYVEKIAEVSLNHKLYDQYLKYVIKFKELLKDHDDDIEAILNNLLENFGKIEFFQQVEIIFNIKSLLKSFPEKIAYEIIQNLNINFVDNVILKYLLLNNLNSQIPIEKYFHEISSEKRANINHLIEQDTRNSVEEAILNMDSEEHLDAYLKVANSCNFSNRNDLYIKIGKYKEKLKDLFIEGLHQKHAFLRSLIIENTHSDKLPEMNFRYKHDYPTLIWTSTRRNESPLYYYVIEKCGIEKHHLEYIDQTFFVENYPIFKDIFNGNNPIEYKVKNFWGLENPQIKNVVKNEKVIEVNFNIDIKELEKYILVEWDLAQRPILGSYICQFSDGFIIPDTNHPLTNEIKPFDLILCYRKPIEIKAGNIKVMRPIRRINFKTAIELIWRGMEFVSTYIPFEIIIDMKKYKIDEIDAYDLVEERFNISFLPDKESIKKIFFEFIHNKIIKALNKIYLNILERPDYKNKVLRMIGFKRYSQIFSNLKQLDRFKRDSLKRESLQLLKIDLKNEVAKILTDLIEKESYNEINIKELKQFAIFRKWTLKLILELKNKLENCKIYKEPNEKYDIHELSTNYYGKMMIDQLAKSGVNLEYIPNTKKILIQDNCLKGLLENYELLKLTPPKIIENK